MNRHTMAGYRVSSQMRKWINPGIWCHYGWIAVYLKFSLHKYFHIILISPF